MNTNKLPLINTTLILIIALLIGYLVFKPKEPNLGYIDNFRLFNGFIMAKELNQLHGEEIATQTIKLDSLKNLKTRITTQEELSSLILQIANQEAVLKQAHVYSKEVTKQVWDTLNEYVQEYGNANEIQIIFGAQGDGNIMYSKKTLDVTDALLAYANKRYTAAGSQ